MNSKDTSDHVSIIGASFQRLFENSKLLDEDSFIAFATSLCRLSSEISGVPFNESDSVSFHKSSRVVRERKQKIKLIWEFTENI